ncbi:MAG: TonB family protein [Alteromonadaceae bacterium]|nr:TonB family protein [Alteromonadaceae bacterium]
MINLVFALIMPLSLLLVIILVIRLPLHRFLSAKQAYQLWFAVPLFIAYWLLPNDVKTTIVVEAPELLVFSVGQQQQSQVLQPGGDLLGAIYLLGATLGFVVIILSSYRVYQRTKSAVSATFSDADVPGDIPVYLADIAAPMLMGVVKPAIFLPLQFTTLYSPTQQQVIIQHELLHHRRRDIVWNITAASLAIIFWFNPLIWLSYRYFRHDQELSCDEAVLDGASIEHRKAYAKAVLASHNPSEMAVIHNCFGRKGTTSMMTQRISNMASPGRYNKLLAWVMLLGLTALAATQFTAQASNTNQPPFKEALKLYKPIVRIQPVYPADAKAQGIEGAVILEYGITPNGTVENIRVIESVPAGVFDDAAKLAVAQWRFVPHDLEGAVNTNKITFKL